MRSWKFLAMVAAIGFSVTATSAFADDTSDFKGLSAGTILLRARGLAVIPESGDAVKSGGINTGYTTGRIGTDVIPEVDGSYFFTDNIAVEVIAGTNGHSVKVGNTNNGTIDLGTVRMLPPTITAQYHFFSQDRVSPYVGAGVNYTFLWTTSKGNNPAIYNVKYSNNFAPALQAGVDVALTGNWEFNFDVKKLLLETDVKVQSALGTLKSSANLDPWLVGIGIGYRF